MKRNLTFAASTLFAAAILSSIVTWADSESDAAQAECEKAMSVYSKEMTTQRAASGQKPVTFDMAIDCKTSNARPASFWRCVTESQSKGNSTIYAMNNCDKLQ